MKSVTSASLLGQEVFGHYARRRFLEVWAGVVYHKLLPACVFWVGWDGKENVQSYVFTVISWQLFLIKTDKKLQMPVNHQFKIDHPVLDESLQIATCVYILYMFDY
ncbi:hypothetical protein MRB53_003697 [Persea americana]|uniref:Uncharacterized protein n=1 Tax=Persea americana TaxID=3435 RepID=A0ACC2MY79_PERAE|nr:hypothetical protein MRB53_003697 [Persea americana]